MTETPDSRERRLKSTLPGGLEPVPTQESEPVAGEVPGELLEKIFSDLVERTGAEREAIKISRAEAVVWNDGSLGCPKPGEFYIQVLMSGYWVVLEVEGVEYDYRVNASGYFTLCEGLLPKRPSDPEAGSVFPLFGINPLTGGIPTELISNDQYPELVIAAVIEDLGARLKVEKEEIVVIASDYTETQSMAPCGFTKTAKETGPVGEGISLGYEVLLQVGEADYRYVAIGGLANYCGIQ